MKHTLLFLFATLFTGPFLLFAQPNVTVSNNANTLAQLLAGQGVVVSNATLNCAGTAAGTFTGGIAAFNFQLDEGIVLATGNAANPNASSLLCTGTDHGRGGYAPLNPIANATTQDACILEFDVEVTTNVLEFTYAFGSDEYPEYVGSQFNDAFGFFITGPGIAGTENIGVVPGTNVEVTINNINGNQFNQFYRGARAGATGYDGTTTALKATVNTVPCETYHFVLAIADGSDGCFDSGVFLERSSLVSVGADLPTPDVSGTLGAGLIYEQCDSATFTFELPTTLNNDFTFDIAIKGTAVNGVDYRFIQDQITIPAGSQSVSTVILPLTDTEVDPGETVEICILDPCTQEEVVCQSVTIEELEADIVDDQEICPGQSVELTVTDNPNYNYSWSPTNGLSCTTCPNPQANPTDSTTYTVEISDNECVITREVTVLPAPQEFPVFTDTAVCAEESVTRDASLDGIVTYEWTPATSGVSNPSAAAPTFTVLDSAVTYTVQATHEFGCNYSESFTLSPHPTYVADVVTNDVLCFGAANGRVFIDQSAGAPVDSFVWDDGFRGNPYTGLSGGDYAVVVYDANGCVWEFDTSITEPDAPLEVETEELKPEECFGMDGEAGATASGGTAPYSFSWNPTGRTTPEIDQLSEGDYEVTVTDANGCVEKDTVFVVNDVSNQKDATITPFGPFCTGADPIQVQTAMPDGIWTGPGISATGMFDPGAAGSGTHQIIYRFDAGNCSDADTFLVQVNSAFQADMLPFGPLCELDPVYNVESVTSGGLYWGPGIADSAFARFDPGLAGPGTHRIYHFVPGDCGELDSLDVTVIEAERGNITEPQDFCPTGMGATLSATPTGGTWSGDGINPQGFFDPALVGTGGYAVTYTPASACRTIDTKTVTVVDTLRPQGETVAVACNGDATATVNTTVNGGAAPYDYNWTDPNVTSTAASAPNLGAGTYTVVITDALGCDTTATHVVTEPTALTLSQPADVTNASCNAACDGTVQVYPQGGTTPYQFTISASTSTLTASGFEDLCAGTHTVTITDANDCVIEETITITEPNAIDVVAQPYTSYCGRPNGGVDVTNVSGGTAPYTYAWSDGSSAQDLVDVVPGDYALTVTDASGCSRVFNYEVPNTGGPDVSTREEPVTCNAGADGLAVATGSGGTAGYTYIWGTSLPITDTLSFDDTLANVPAGTYYVQITDAELCSQTAMQEVTEPTAVVLSEVIDSTICQQQVYRERLVASGGNPTTNYGYEEDGGPLSDDSLRIPTPGTYQYQAFDAEGCPSNIIDVTVSMLPPIDVIASSWDSICAGTQVEKSVQSTRGGRAPYEYSWYSNDGEIGPDLDTWNYNSVKDSVNALTKENDTLYVVASDGCSPNDTTYTVVHYFDLPELDATPSPSSGCVPLTVTFTLTDEDYQELEWKFAGETYESVYQISRTFEQSGTYGGEIEAISKEGCPVNAQILPEVEVYPLPQGEIIVSPQPLTILSNSAVIDISSNLTLGDVEWTVLDNSGDTAFVANEVYGFDYEFDPVPAFYTVIANMITPFGCQTEISKEIEVESRDIMYVPKAFSPDGDGINDVFKLSILGELSETFKIHIANRWGEVVYTSDQEDFEWDGTYRGEKSQPGVYPWRITYTTETGKIREYNGNVVLLR